MKRFIVCLLTLCLLLTGCTKTTPEQAADGTAWNESWTTLGGVLEVEEPGHDLTLQDNKDALSITDMYLASWTIGEGEPYTNEDGDEVVLYPARLDVLVYGCKDADAAQQALEDWTARQAETYDVTSCSPETQSTLVAGKKRIRSTSVCVWLSPDEQAKIQERMADVGIRNLSAYMRKMALNGYVLHVDLAPVTLLNNDTASPTHATSTPDQVSASTTITFLPKEEAATQNSGSDLELADFCRVQDEIKGHQ